MAAPQLKEAFKFSVEVKRGPHAGQKFNFNKNPVLIGRGPENDLALTSDLRASRHHAEIQWDGFELKIVNVSTKNFVVIDGNHMDLAVLGPGSVVVVGDTEFIIDFPGEPKTKISFNESATAISSQPHSQPQPPPAPSQTSSFLTPLNNQGPMASMPTPPAPSPMVMPSVHGMTGGAAGGQQYYSTQNPQSTTPRSRGGAASPGLMSNPRVRFYGIIAIAGLIGFWLFTGTPKVKKELTLRSTEQIQKDLDISREEMKEFEARKEKMDTMQFRRAQENYIRGFRDYKQGNYGRARESFQVVLNLDPDNDLAKRYYQLSRMKFDEMVKFHMLQGNRYREKKSWRLCKSSYFNVMTMVTNNQDPIFKEAKQYYDQCSLAQEGRF